MSRSIKQFTSLLNRLAPTVQSAVVREVRGTAPEASEAMRERIETVRSALNPTKIGRVQSGAMRDRVGQRVKKEGPNVYRMDVGWLRVPKKFHYFAIQEYGGQSTDRGRSVWGMHAIEYATEKVVRLLATEAVVHRAARSVLK